MTQDTPAALNPEHFLPLGAIVNGTTCIERLERDYAFQCEAGPLVNCADWDMLKRCFFHLAEHAQEIAQREPDDTTGWKGTQAATSAAGGATGDAAQAWMEGFEAHRKWTGVLQAFQWDHATDEPDAPAMPVNPYRAALTQAADAGAAEPVATIEALQARIAALEAELDDMEAERDEALRGPWPEWAERMKTTIRKYSGYDGIDDASEGIDLAAELDELMEHAVEPSAQQLQQAVARATEEAAKRTLDHISKVIWVERDRYVTLLGKCIAQGDKKRADTYEQIARALDELHEGIQP